MRSFRAAVFGLLFLMVCLSTASRSLAEVRRAVPKVLRSWEGKVNGEAIREAAKCGPMLCHPDVQTLRDEQEVLEQLLRDENSLVLLALTDGDSWKRLWTRFRPKEEVPKIDFHDELVLVALNGNSNSIGVMLFPPKRDDDLSASCQYGLAPNWQPWLHGYQFAVVSRKGLKTINGKAIRSPK
jgi:hypothetical protein